MRRFLVDFAPFHVVMDFEERSQNGSCDAFVMAPDRCRYLAQIDRLGTVGDRVLLRRRRSRDFRVGGSRPTFRYVASDGAPPRLRFTRQRMLVRRCERAPRSSAGGLRPFDLVALALGIPRRAPRDLEQDRRDSTPASSLATRSERGGRPWFRRTRHHRRRPTPKPSASIAPRPSRRDVPDDRRTPAAVPVRRGSGPPGPLLTPTFPRSAPPAAPPLRPSADPANR